jgi:membrane protease YdiL (CAAX protease family)
VEIENRAQFLNLAGMAQGGIVFLALALGLLAGIKPLGSIHWSAPDAAWGAAGILPMLAAFFAAPGLRQIVIDLLGRLLSLCRWYDLLLLSALAGLGEELLFRGVLQPWMGRLHPLAGLIGANVLFGLMHAVSPGYALLATAFGFYLSWLVDGPGEPNLLRPIVAHGLYDFVALLLIVREYRRGAGATTRDDRVPERADAPPAHDSEPPHRSDDENR